MASSAKKRSTPARQPLDTRIKAEDRALIAVDPKAYDELVTRLDAPAKPNERLRRTMRTPPPWIRTPDQR